MVLNTTPEQGQRSGLLHDLVSGLQRHLPHIDDSEQSESVESREKAESMATGQSTQPSDWETTITDISSSLSVDRSICLSIYLSIYPSIHLSISLSIG